MTIKLDENGVFIANYPGDDPNVAIFGPDTIIDTFGEMNLSDYRAKQAARINPPKEFLEEYAEYYEVTGGVFALITRKKRARTWELSIIVHSSDLPAFPKKHKSMESAWNWLKENVKQ